MVSGFKIALAVGRLVADLSWWTGTACDPRIPESDFTAETGSADGDPSHNAAIAYAAAAGQTAIAVSDLVRLQSGKIARDRDSQSAHRSGELSKLESAIAATVRPLRQQQGLTVADMAITLLSR